MAGDMDGCLLILNFNSQWYNQSDEVKDVLKIVNVFFTTLFTIECGMKVIAYGPKVRIKLRPQL